MGAERRPEEALDRMQAAIDRQRADGDPVTSLDANREFHLALVAASGNPHLTHLSELLWVARISVAIYTAQAAQVGGTSAWSDEHEGILAAMRAGDGATAERLTREHIERHPPVAQDR
jgi:DNA-binding FadR family transcriptional regulator